MISPGTKALVIVHYGGMAFKMEMISKLVQENDIYLIEDAAAAIDAYYQGEDRKKIPLGSMGHMAAFSFHETKNISCGERGMLVVNDASFHRKALEVWNRGTNRSAFEVGMHKACKWLSSGSAFALSEINAAWLWAQLEQLENSQKKERLSGIGILKIVIHYSLLLKWKNRSFQIMRGIIFMFFICFVLMLLRGEI